MSFNETPIKHSTEVKKTELSYTKTQCTSMNGNPAKEQLNMLADSDPKEAYIMLLKGIKTLTNRHKWFGTSSDNNRVKLAFETMGRALLENPLELWEQAADNL